MKRIISILLLVALATTASAQDPQFDNIRQHNVKLNIISPLIGASVGLGYEYDFNHRFGVNADLASNLLQSKDNAPSGIFTQVQGRFYIAKLRNWGCAMPFVGVGANFTYAWRQLDCFVSNDGWDITTRPYYIDDCRLYPQASFGIRVNTPCGITIENTVGLIFHFDYSDSYSPSDVLMFSNYFATNITTKIGWSF